MRIVLQRVSQARVEVGGAVVGAIDRGLLILLGITSDDAEDDADFLVRKVAGLRIFPDSNGKMNLSVKDVKGSALVVSQFTLYGDVSRGMRPSFDGAAPPSQARMLYEYFVEKLRESGIRVETGVFQAMMAVHLCNDGPVTLIVESQPYKH